MGGEVDDCLCTVGVAEVPAVNGLTHGPFEAFAVDVLPDEGRTGCTF